MADSQTETVTSGVPADKVTLDNTLPKGWDKEGTFVGRVMIPGVGPAIVRLEKNGTLTDITETYSTMSKLCAEADPAAAAWKAEGKSLGKLSDILAASPTDQRTGKTPHLLAPIDLQTVKAAGVTFAVSLVQRMVEEEAEKTGRPAKQIEEEIEAVIGGSLRELEPGTEKALKLLDHIKAPKKPDGVVIPQNMVEEIKDIVAGGVAGVASHGAKILEYLGLIAKGPDIDPKKQYGLGLSHHYPAVGLGKLAEIFTKADTLACVGHGSDSGYLAASNWNNPEPEVVVVTSPTGKIVGATLGNDINHRDIEGYSALLLGECKNQKGSCVVGPFIRLFDNSFSIKDVNTMDVELEIKGNDNFTLSGQKNSMSQISRSPEALTKQMYSEGKEYKDGAALFCGTMFVPKYRHGEEKFAHKEGDIVTIKTDKLGSLTSQMVHCPKVSQPEPGLSELMENLAERKLLSRGPEWGSKVAKHHGYSAGLSA